MNQRRHITNGLILLALFAGTFSINTFAQSDSAGTDSKIVDDFWSCASPTNGFWGLNDALADSGIEVGAGLTTIYQVNAKGGTSTTKHSGRHTGRYDLEMSLDLEKILGIEGGTFFIHGWGGWPDTEGIDESSVGSAWGINALAVGNRSLDIVEAFYEGPFFSDNLTIAIGKLDFTGIFDASEYADDECCQFLNAALIDDPTIPFPEQGLGIVLNWDVTDSWYLMTGVIDAQADGRTTGFSSTFHDEAYFFYALETGITQGDGTYRMGLWYDPQPKANSDRAETERDDLGFYTSCDRRLTKENDNPEDSQGLGAFVRYGYAPSKTNDINNFWSVGLQYQGLIDGRDDDIFGLGYAQGCFSDSASTTYPEDYESVLEAYYNAQITPWLHVSPAVQYVTNPGGSDTAGDAIVLSLRTAMTF
ncbi:MAG: carbohydrate porin [Planctomycetota bacterium]|jgi:porin